MKKVLTILLIALCCVSVFAADVAASVSFKMSFDKDGYHFVPYSKGLGSNGVICLSVTGDIAGTSIKIVPTRFENIDIDCSIWVKPFASSSDGFQSPFIEEGTEVPEALESLKLTVGAKPSISLKDGFDVSEMASYGTVTNSFNEQPNGLGFLYKPKDNVLYVAGLTNISLTSFGVLHADVLTKLDMDGYKPSLNYALGELTYCNTLDSTNLCISDEGMAGYNKVPFTGEQNINISELFKYEEEDWAFTSKPIGASRLVAGLRFKHYTEFAKEKENGLYGYGVFQYYYNEDIQNGFYVEAEAGRNVGELRLKDSLTIEAFSGIANAIADFDWSNGNFNAKLDEVVGWARYQHERFTPKLSVDYLNKDANTAEENGFFVTPEVDFSVGASAHEAKVKLGLDSLNNFQWDASLFTIVNF